MLGNKAKKWPFNFMLVSIYLQDKRGAGLDQVYPIDKFETSMKKWKRISEVVMNAGCYEHLYNDPTCEDKWEFVSCNFKRITC